MADTMYRRPPVTLQDVLLGANSGIAPPVAPAQPSPDNQDYGLLTPEKRNQLMDALLQPTSLGPEPQVENRSIGSEIFAGLGDALGAYASGINGGPRPQYGNEYYGRREMQRQERDKFRKQAALLEAQNRQRSAEILLGQDDRARIKQDDLRARRELKDLTLQTQRDDRLERERAARAKEAQDLLQQQETQRFAKEMEDIRFGHEKITANVRAGAAAGDKQAMQDAKELSGLYGTISALAATAKQNLASGATTPEELDSLVQDEIDKATLLSPEGQKAAQLYYARKLRPILREAEAVQASKAQQGTTVEQAPYAQTSGYKMSQIPGQVGSTVGPVLKSAWEQLLGK